MTVSEQVFSVKDKVILVTGAAGLIGSHFCDVLAQAHATTILADIDERKVQKNVLDIQGKGYRATGIQVDITSPVSINEMVEQVESKYGCLDVLVHCAALDPKFDRGNMDTHNLSFEDYPLDLWQEAIQVNLTGAFLCAQATARAMLKSGSGVMVLLASIYGMVAPDQRIYKDGLFKPPYYSVSKAGILGLTRYIASYYAGKNIRANALSPGGIYHDHDENFTREYSSRSIIGRMAELSELDGALLFLASDASSYMTGANLVVDGGWTAW